jgi:hypothetical protein
VTSQNPLPSSATCASRKLGGVNEVCEAQKQCRLRLDASIPIDAASYLQYSIMSCLNLIPLAVLVERTLSASVTVEPSQAEPFCLARAVPLSHHRAPFPRRAEGIALQAAPKTNNAGPRAPMFRYPALSDIASSYRPAAFAPSPAEGEGFRYRSPPASEWASAPIRRRAKGSRVWSQGLEGVAK